MSQNNTLKNCKKLNHKNKELLVKKNKSSKSKLKELNKLRKIDNKYKIFKRKLGNKNNRWLKCRA